VIEHHHDAPQQASHERHPADEKREGPHGAERIAASRGLSGIVGAMRRAVRIALDTDLPPRPRAIDEVAMSQVYGGCAGAYQPCRVSTDCCPAQSDKYVLQCLYNPLNGTSTCRYAA